MKFVKKALRSFQPTARLLELHFLSKKLLTTTGWFTSLFEGKPIDGKGSPIPWFSYSSIDFLDKKLDSSKHSIFEFGSGNSTIWFASKSKRVVSIEHDIPFYNYMKPALAKLDNVECIQGSLGGNYSNKILDFKNEFNVAVVDGRERIQCAKNCVEALTADGVIIWDNSERMQYKEGYDFLASSGFKRIDFIGLGPINHSEAQTTIFYRTNNCFGI